VSAKTGKKYLQKTPGYYIEEADRFVLNEKQILNKE
jgi:hypothetical protein